MFLMSEVPLKSTVKLEADRGFFLNVGFTLVCWIRVRIGHVAYRGTPPIRKRPPP